ncbi:MAG: phosphopentomutase [bacterium]|jgi:phosphopentomutase
MGKIARVVIVVMDSVGIGALPDAAAYGDERSNTVGNIVRARPDFHLPNLIRLGLGAACRRLDPDCPLPAGDNIAGCYGVMREMSPGKDTTTGHWEMVGVILDKPFPVYPAGFPAEIIDALVRATGREVLGNKAASGTAIIEELGTEQMRTGRLIVYTSADSVFQIAAHESVIPVEELYAICRTARDILRGEHAVGRVIARPFTGSPGAFVRTANRHDYALPPPQPTVLDAAAARGFPVVGIGKVRDIFAGRGITASNPTKSNDAGIDALLENLGRRERGIIFANLVDFDMLFGHRNDVGGYADALAAFDRRLPEITAALQPEDILILTADHGCDPTTASTDHSREHVPLLVSGAAVRRDRFLGIRPTFADLGATAAELLGLAPPRHGASFAGEIIIQEGEDN